MCGLAGILATGGLAAFDREALAGMGEAIRHRGPDAGDCWSDPVGIGLAHRRLSIIDLSPAGAQPMMSASGRYVIAYNGEIYNFAELRAELDAEGRAPNWRGHSDTEVALAACEAWGIERTLARFVGMFALALWDRAEQRLVLARDRLGEKPLYYGWQGSGRQRRLLFGSDLASLRRHPSFEGAIDSHAIEDLCRLLYIPEPRTVYVGISKLAPGTLVSVDLASGAERTTQYFDLAAFAAAAKEEGFSGSAEDAVDALETVLGTAITRQMVSDVPLGAFLSGGIDSTSVVALMQSQSARPVKTFTIGFGEERFNEAVAAKAVAAHLGTEHHELQVSAGEALDVIPLLPQIFSEPFADSSQIPTFLVSRMARQQVTVSLSGDGGDEMFGGYNRHRYAHLRWPALARMPRGLRSLGGRLAAAVSPAAWDAVLGRSLGLAQPGDKIHKAASVIASQSPEALYRALIAVNPEPGSLLRADRRRRMPSLGAAFTDASAGWPLAERMMLQDALEYLPGDILVKVDRAAMAVSLETRVPFLDPDVIRLAWRLPIDLKIRNGQTKWPLRALLDRYLPPALVTRPKMGFGIPLADWLRGPLRDWAETHLSANALASGDLFDPAAVQRIWRVHQSGRANLEHRLWPILITQAWLAHHRVSNQNS